MDNIERERDALHSIDPSLSREDWLKAAMAAKAAGLQFDDFHNWSATAGNYKSENDCRTVWKSIKPDGGVTAASLFQMAREHGWHDTNGRLKNVSGYPSRTQSEIIAPAPVKQAESAKAAEIWAYCIPATPAEPYIHRKRGKPDGLRIYPANAPPLTIRGQNVVGYLVVPCWDGVHLQTLQFIPKEKGES